MTMKKTLLKHTALFAATLLAFSVVKHRTK